MRQRKKKIDEYHYELVKWAMDFVLVPLHFMAFLHYYVAAMWAGAFAFLAFGTVAFLSAPRVPVAVEASTETDPIRAHNAE